MVKKKRLVQVPVDPSSTSAGNSAQPGYLGSQQQPYGSYQDQPGYAYSEDLQQQQQQYGAQDGSQGYAAAGEGGDQVLYYEDGQEINVIPATPVDEREIWAPVHNWGDGGGGVVPSTSGAQGSDINYIDNYSVRSGVSTVPSSEASRDSRSGHKQSQGLREDEGGLSTPGIRPTLRVMPPGMTSTLEATGEQEEMNSERIIARAIARRRSSVARPLNLQLAPVVGVEAGQEEVRRGSTSVSHSSATSTTTTHLPSSPTHAALSVAQRRLAQLQTLRTQRALPQRPDVDVDNIMRVTGLMMRGATMSPSSQGSGTNPLHTHPTLTRMQTMAEVDDEQFEVRPPTAPCIDKKMTKSYQG